MRKNNGVSCNTPIGSITCRTLPNGYLGGFYYGAWPAAGAYTTPTPAFIQGEGNYWYTQNWCDAFGKVPRCAQGAVGSSDKVVDFGAVTSPGAGQADVNFLKGFTVCYGPKKSVKGITWSFAKYTVGYVASAGNPPISTYVAVNPPQADQTCGITTNCLAKSTFTASGEKVIGGIWTKCKFEQGWFKYVQNGQYKSLYRLEGIDKVCTTYRECPGAEQRGGGGAQAAFCGEGTGAA